MTIEDRYEKARRIHLSGDLAGAAAGYGAILAQAPDHAAAEAGLGVIALQTGRLSDALLHLSRAHDRAPDDAKIANNLGNTRLALGRIEEALQAFNAAVHADPELLDARYNRGVAQQRLNRRAEAEADYLAVLESDQSRMDAAVNLAAVYRAAEDPHAAIQVLESALQRVGPQDDALLSLAALLETVGDTNGSANALAALSKARRNDPQAVLTRARLALRAGDPDGGLETLRSLPADAPDQARRQAHYLSGLLLDKAGRIDEAFAAFTAGNNAMRASRANADQMANRYLRRIDDYRSLLTSAPSLPPPETAFPFSLVFFCGFPRSGTTLMEQILEAHPETVTTGEDSPLQHLYEEALPTPPAGRNIDAHFLANLDASARDSLRRTFRSIVERQKGDIAGRTLIDKLPLNLIELGVIARLFPDAKVLVALRDPRDCVLSGFMQPFRLNDAMACFLDLDRVASTYAAVMDLYAAQKDTCGLPIEEYRYEDLIDDFDGTVRRVIAFLGLNWHDDIANYRNRLAGRYIATPSYIAVTKGLNRQAIGRWRRYEHQMTPILPVLAPFAARFGYDSQ
ncbi:MAG: sulfotransferase [Alphaproteobacteria bacterium]